MKRALQLVRQMNANPSSFKVAVGYAPWCADYFVLLLDGGNADVWGVCSKGRWAIRLACAIYYLLESAPASVLSPKVACYHGDQKDAALDAVSQYLADNTQGILPPDQEDLPVRWEGREVDDVLPVLDHEEIGRICEQGSQTALTLRERVDAAIELLAVAQDVATGELLSRL